VPTQAGQGEGADRVEGLRALIYLPAYSSPEFNPIEEAFAKIKGMLRQAGACTKDALIEALGEAISAVGAQDAQGYFQHAGYRPRAQLL
jgi:transposase